MPIGLEFQKRYATTVLELEQLNKDLNKVLHEVQQFCYEVTTHWHIFRSTLCKGAIFDCLAARCVTDRLTFLGVYLARRHETSKSSPIVVF